MRKVIHITTFNDYRGDFQSLFTLYNEVINCNEDIEFNFSKCNFLRPNAVAFIGGLARLIQQTKRAVTFDWYSVKNDAVMANLCQNGFANSFNHTSSGWDGNSIPYREDPVNDMNGVMDYLTFNWIGKGWVQVSDPLKDAIVGRMWEIYSNAFEHSETPIGVFSCGQLFRRHNRLILSTVDFGKGIPCSVRDFLVKKGVDPQKVSRLSSGACLNWAFTRGNTTCNAMVARGLGLDLLKEFVQVNQGKLEIYSNDGYAIVDKDGERFENCNINFSGTIVHITLCCDETIYRFGNEV